MMENRAIPRSTVIPVLQYPDVVAAATWLCGAFGFRERLRIATHRIQLYAGDGALVVAEGEANGAGNSIMIRVDDADAHAARSAEQDARIVNPPATYPYGERQYSVIDPWGHAWTFTQSVEDVDPASWGGELLEP